MTSSADDAGTHRVGDTAHDLLVETVAEIKPRLRGWLHAGTTPLAFLSFLVMLVLAEGTMVRAGVAVFMISAVLLFGTSAIYHTRTWTPQRLKVLKRVDHANIFVLIAGSSTPFAILLLSEQHAMQLITIMWWGATLGVLFKVFWLDVPRAVHVPLYLLLGWAPVFYTADFLDSAQHAPLILLAAGGALYSLGALVYIFKWPNPSPRYFGFHEVFHAMTIAAFAAHYVGISILVYT
ncbi:MAG: hemolysin III family protein [Aeromicrobium sp.]